VKVREEYPVHILPPDLDLGEALQSTSTRIEQELLSSGFDQNARPEAIHDRLWSTGPQKGDLDFLPLGSDWDNEHQK
jgi:hypothetical protein